MIRKFVPTAVLVLCLLFTVQVAKADNFTFSINNFGQGGSLGVVNTTLVGGAIQVQVLINPNYVIHGAGVGFNVNPAFTGITITDLTPATIFSQDLGAHNFDGYGSFAYSAASNQSTAQARVTTTNVLTFTVNTTTPGGFTNAGQIFSFAVQIAPLVNNGATGFATTTVLPGPSPVPTQFDIETPEPASMMLFGTGLVGLGGYLRKRFKR